MKVEREGGVEVDKTAEEGGGWWRCRGGGCHW